MIRNTLVFLMLLLTLVFSGCSNCTEASNAFPRENPLFAKLTEPILGLNTLELQDLIGLPNDIEEEGCSARASGFGVEKPTTHTGTNWIYSHGMDGLEIELTVCILKGYVVTQTSTWTATIGSRVSVSVKLLTDTELTADVVNGRMGDSRGERTAPPTGRKIEV